GRVPRRGVRAQTARGGSGRRRPRVGGPSGSGDRVAPGRRPRGTSLTGSALVRAEGFVRRPRAGGGRSRPGRSRTLARAVAVGVWLLSAGMSEAAAQEVISGAADSL